MCVQICRCIIYICVGFLVVGAHNFGLVTLMFAFDRCELLRGQHKKSEIRIGVNTFMKYAFCVFHTYLVKILIRLIVAKI